MFYFRGKLFCFHLICLYHKCFFTFLLPSLLPPPLPPSPSLPSLPSLPSSLLSLLPPPPLLEERTETLCHCHSSSDHHVVVCYHLSLCGSWGQAVMAALPQLLVLLYPAVCDHHQICTSGEYGIIIIIQSVHCNEVRRQKKRKIARTLTP